MLKDLRVDGEGGLLKGANSFFEGFEADEEVEDPGVDHEVWPKLGEDIFNKY